MWGKQDDKRAIATIRKACDKGVNLFDTAEEYGDGHSEELLGRALADRRKNVYIASKVTETNLRPDDLKKACENSMRRLDTDYLDIYYVHWPNPDIPIEETIGGLKELRKEGKIRYFAPSNFGVSQLNEFSEEASIFFDQLPYSLLWRAIEYEVKPYCLKNGIGLVTYSPLLHGMLAGKFENPEEVPPGRARTRHFSGNRPNARHGEGGAEKETFETIARIREVCQSAGVNMAQAAIAWVLEREGVGTVMVGARNPEQIEENIRAIDLDLSPGVTERLTEVTEQLKEVLGPNPDMWQGGNQARMS